MATADTGRVSVGTVERCAECGYDYGGTPRQDLAAALRDRARAFRPTLVGVDDRSLREHDSPGVWSVLEYGCHVRDLLTVQRHRVTQAMDISR